MLLKSALDSLGRAWRKFLNNGLYEEYTYDASNRLISVGLYNPSPSTMIRFESYTYNLANQMTSKTVGGVTTTYTYDLAGQLASESRPGYSCSYTYDANGNRLTKTLNGVTETYTYDDGDKMLTAGSKSYGYDAAGRTTSVTNGSSVTNLSYDWESRLTSLSGATTASYTYNGLDTRVSKIEGGTTTNYVRDGVGVTAPVIRDTFASYTPGTSERRGTTTTFLHSGLKNAEMQTDSAKAVSATKQYDAFGNLTSSTGTWQGVFGYAAGFGYQEDASGLKLLGHRYYDSSTGRFLTRDPAKDGRNWYTYCENNPLTSVDTDGLEPWWIKIIKWGKGALKGGEKLIPKIIEAIIIGPILPIIELGGPWKISPSIINGGSIGLVDKDIPIPGLKYPLIKFGGGKHEGEEEDELIAPDPNDFGPPQHSGDPIHMEPSIPENRTMLLLCTYLLSTSVVPNFFTADLWYKGRKGRFAVSLDYPESAMAQVSGDGSIQVSQREFASKFNFGKIDNRDKEVLVFLKDNDLVGIVGRDNLQKCVATYSLVSGEVSFARKSETYRSFLPGSFTEEGFVLKPAEGVSYLLTSRTSTHKSVTSSDKHLLSLATGQEVYVSEQDGGIAFFKSAPRGEATRVGLAAWGAKEIQISADGISFNRDGELILAQLCDLIPAWCEEASGEGVRVYPCMGVMPVGLKPGDLITSIQGINLTRRDWREKAASEVLEAMRIQEWEVKILERNGKTKALSINRSKLYKP